MDPMISIYGAPVTQTEELMLHASEIIKSTPFFSLSHERVAVRSYFLWENRTHPDWQNTEENWRFAEEQEAQLLMSFLVRTRDTSFPKYSERNFEEDYRLLFQERFNLWDPPPGKRFFGTREPRHCSLCGRSKPEVTFRTEAHIIPESMGRRGLITYDECDQCNKRTNADCDNHLSNMFGLEKALLGVATKSRSVSKHTLASKRSSVGGHARNEPMRIELREGDDSVSWSLNGTNEIELQTFVRPYRPVGAIKAIGKMVWHLLPEEKRTDHGRLRAWIAGELEFLPFKYYSFFIPGGLQTMGIAAWEAKDHAEGLPELVAVFWFGTSILVTGLPSSKRDLFDLQIFPMLPRSPYGELKVIPWRIESDELFSPTSEQVSFGFCDIALAYSALPMQVKIQWYGEGEVVESIFCTLITQTDPDSVMPIVFLLSEGDIMGTLHIERHQDRLCVFPEINSDSMYQTRNAERTLAFLYAVTMRRGFKVIERDTGNLLLVSPCLPTPEESEEISFIRSSHELAKRLMRIEEAFGHPLCFPGDLCKLEVDNILLISEGIDMGFGIVVPEEPTIILIQTGDVEDFCASLRTGVPSLISEVTLELQVSGQILDCGPVAIVLKSPQLVPDAPQIAVPSADQVRITIQVETIEYWFRRWKRDAK